MRSKIILTLVLVQLVSACGWVQDKPSTSKSLNVENLNLDCLAETPTKLQTLFEGRYTSSAADQQSVNSIWGCLTKSLYAFRTYTYGATKDVYTPEEMRHFANIYLLQDRSLTPQMVEAIFKLKMSVIGGSATELTPTEIKALEEKVTRFGQIILPLAPHFATLLQPSAQVSMSEKIQTGKALHQFMINLAVLLGDSKNSLKWADLAQFITELEKLTGDGKPSTLGLVREQVPLYQQAKLLLVGGDETGIETKQWDNLFTPVTKIYNALFLTRTNTELFDELSIDIKSNEAERRKAVKNITALLINLKNDPKVTSQTMITSLSNSWSELLLLNSFVFPQEQGSLAIKTFFGSDAMRTRAGRLLDNLAVFKTNSQDPALVAAIADDLSNILKEAYSSDKSGSGRKVKLSFAELKAYATELRPLFANQDDYSFLIAAIDTLSSINGVLIGKTDELSSNNLSSLIGKVADLYLAWNSTPKKTVNEAISESISILVRDDKSLDHSNNSFYMLTAEQLYAALDHARILLDLMNKRVKTPTTVDWNLFRSYVANGLKVKAILFGNSAQTLSNYELKQLLNLVEPIKKDADLKTGLSKLAETLASKPFADAQIADLIPAIDAFLPEGKKIASFGLTVSQIGMIKSILVGGSTTKIARAEYSSIALLGAAIAENVMPIANHLPKDFSIGLNSQTIGMARGFLKAVVSTRNGQISNEVLRDLLISYLGNMHPPRPISKLGIERLLTGINQRIFSSDHKNKKRTVMPKSFSGEQLGIFLELLNPLTEDLKDIEGAFQGVSEKTSLNRSVLNTRLKTPMNKKMVHLIRPILSGVTGAPYLSPSTVDEYYQNDLLLKAVMFDGLSWVFPKYKIDADPEFVANGVPRLSVNDEEDLLTDINDVTYETGLTLSLGNPGDTARERMQSINLFTQIGNGDEYIDAAETTEFLTLSVGGRGILNGIFQELALTCYGRKDWEKVPSFSKECLSEHFFQKDFIQRHYANALPELAKHFNTLSDEDREKFKVADLTATKPTWAESNDGISYSDMETLVSALTFAENIFIHLDTNRDNTLQFSEMMRGFPTFCGAIKKAAGTSVKGECGIGQDPNQVEAIYGYLIFNGVPPRGIKKGDSIFRKVKEAFSFLKWVRQWKKLDKDPEVRDVNPPQLLRKDLISIISNLSASIAPTPPQQEEESKPAAPDSSDKNDASN